MTSFLIPQETDTTSRRYASFFTGTMLKTIIAFIMSLLLFPVQSGIISVFFTSFSLITAMEAILEKNKNDIWTRKLSSFRANLDMALSLAVIFGAVLVAYAAIARFALQPEQVKITFFSQIHDTMTHTHLLTNHLSSIIGNRVTICLIFFFVSLVYRVGMVFVLVWLASVWGIIYGLSSGQHSTPNHLVMLSFSGFAVLFIRTLSFITASMSGMFFSKALGKYKIGSTEFRQVLVAVMKVLAVSLLLLSLAIYGEFRDF